MALPGLTLAPMLRGLPALKITDLRAVGTGGSLFFRVYTDGGV